MTNKEAIRELSALMTRQPDYAVALDKAISALQAQEEKTQLSREDTTSDLISRQAAIDALMEFDKKLRKINWYQYPHTEYECRGVDEAIVKIENVPSAQPEPFEITDEQAILHLQSTGWMQNHDREMYESGLREQLADDSGSYDSLIPYEDTISRQAAVALANSLKDDLPDDERIADIVMAHNEGILEYQTKLSLLPSAKPEIEERTEEFAQNVPKEDLISRKAAIDAEFEVCQIAPKKERGHNCTYYVHGCKEIECLRALPSAQPEPLVKESRTLVKDLVKDTISRQATIDALVKAIRKDPYYDTIMRAERRTDDLQ